MSGEFPLAFANPGSGLSDTSETMRELDELMVRARVSVYPVDARGLMTLPNVNPANDNTVQATTLQNLAQGGFSNDALVPMSWADQHMAMRFMAEETGGKAYYDNNTVGQSAVAAIEDGSNYYTLGFDPTNRKFNGAFRRITVSLDNRGYQLSYRRGYIAASSSTRDSKTRPLSPMAGAMLHGGIQLSQVIFEARVLPASDPALEGIKPSVALGGTPERSLKRPLTRYIIDFSIDPHQFDLTDLADARRRAEVEIALAVFDSDGVRVNRNDTGLQIDLSRDKLAGYMRTGIPIRQEIDVPSGRSYLKMGIRDVASGRIGTIEISLRTTRKDSISDQR